MTRTIFTDRSRIETAQHCMRERYLRYHQNGVGLESARKPLPLAVGGAVHRGLEVLLRGQMGIEWDGADRVFLRDVEQAAVDAAVADLAQYKSALAVDPNEQAAMIAPTDLQQQMA